MVKLKVKVVREREKKRWLMIEKGGEKNKEVGDGGEVKQELPWMMELWCLLKCHNERVKFYSFFFSLHFFF